MKSERRMNGAEQKRDEKIAKMTDRELLYVLTAPDRDEAVTADEYKAFTDMRVAVEDGATLSRKQRRWAEDAARRIVPLDAKDVPRGREVATPDVLKNLPTRPPGRKP